MDKDELIDIWREVVLKNTTNGSCNFQQAAIDFAELVAKPWVETNKALANEIIELQKQAEQEPVAWMNDSTPMGVFARHKEGAQNFGCTIPLYAAPVRTKDLTDDDIFKTNKTELPDCQDLVDFARAVIAADREKNK